MSYPDDDTAPREERVTISRAALRLELLEMEVRLKDFWSVRFAKVESDVRELQSINQQRTAAEAALAIETERRRRDIATEQDARGTTWSIRNSKAAIAGALIAGAALTATVALTIHALFG